MAYAGRADAVEGGVAEGEWEGAGSVLPPAASVTEGLTRARDLRISIHDQKTG